jgi:Domain of unknown function (DUF3303)
VPPSNSRTPGNDLVVIAKWMREWTDILTFVVHPILNDEDVMTVLA